jgi:histidine triad (HIT) family protein
MPNDCIFCRIANHEIPAKLAYEDDDLVAFHDLHPQAPVHVLIVPKRHTASMNELGPEDLDVMGRIPHVAAKLAKEVGISETGYRLVCNCGPNAGQTIFHIHFHLMGGRSMRGEMV